MTAPKKPSSFHPQLVASTDEQELYLRDTLRDYLSTRGVTYEQAIENGIIPAWDSDPRALTIQTVKRHHEQRQRDNLPDLPGFLIQYSETYYTFRYLCDEEDYPTDVNRGKKVKLACPSGKGIPPHLVLTELAKLPPGTGIRITESVLKAIALRVRRHPAIGLNGVFTWGKQGALHPDLLAAFTKYNLIPVICFDANAHPGPASNPDVVKAQKSLIVALYDAGCETVKVEIVPPKNGRRDQGLDDYLGAGGKVDDLDRYTAEPDGTKAVKVYTAKEFSAQDFPAAVPVINGIIDRGESNMLISPPKVGKTRMALSTALAASNGKADLFGNPDWYVPEPVLTLLVALEDKQSEIHRNATNFAAAAGLRYPNDHLLILTDLPDGADVLAKIEQVRKKHPALGLIILDNFTIAESTAGRREAEGVPLTIREYRKTKRYTDYARASNIAMLILFHAKKGAGSQSTIADKTNSTASAAGGVDNNMSLDRPPKRDTQLEEHHRIFSIQARTHRGGEFVLGIEEDGVYFLGELREFDMTDTQSQYLVAIWTRARDKGDERTFVTAEEIVKLMPPTQAGKPRALSTVFNAIRSLVRKGHVEGQLGPNGGYRLTAAGAELMSKLNKKV